MMPPLAGLEHLHKSCSVFGVQKEVLAVGCGDGGKSVTGRLKQFRAGARCQAAEGLLDFTPPVFNWVEVGGIRWQIKGSAWYKKV
jgi:hypothetical protein